MADLSARLPTEIDSQKRFVQPPAHADSIFENLADFGSKVVGVISTASNALEHDKQGKAAAAELHAKNDTILTFAKTVLPALDPASQPNIPPGSEGAYNSAKALAGPVANSQTAARQGAVDPGMAQAKSVAAFRQALAQNPGHEYAVWQAFKDTGADNMLMQQYNNAEKSIESDQSAEQATMHKLEDDAVNKYGHTDYYQKTPDERAVIRAQVGQLNLQEADLEAKTKLASLTTQNLQLTTEQKKEADRNNSQALMGSFTNYMTGNFSHLSKMMINMLGDPDLSNDPARMEKLQSHLMSVSFQLLILRIKLRLLRSFLISLRKIVLSLTISSRLSVSRWLT
jgi:antitoxin component HigA of HigAB toxin-antitoxin module